MILASWIKTLNLLKIKAKFLAALAVIGLPLTGCSAAQLEAAHQADLWLCPDGSVIETRLATKQLWLQLPGSSSWLALPQQRAASGQRFSDEAGTSVWISAQRSRIATPQRLWQNCQLTASGTPGQLRKPQLISGTNLDPNAVVLQAQGGNPKWTFEAKQNGQLLLLQNFGTQRIKFTGAKILSQDLITTLYQAQDQQGNSLHYKIENILCIDTATGTPFAHRVELNYLEQKLLGCGQSF